MTDEIDARMEHPDELLAGYVDGSASTEERETVETHLAGCSKCRNDVALAQAGRAALMSLPDLEAPGLAANGIEGLRLGASGEAGSGDELGDRRQARGEGERQLRRWRASWAALAGTAAVLALLAVIPIVLSHKGGQKSLSSEGGSSDRPAPQAASRYPVVLDLGTQYDQQSLQALARQLGQDLQKQRSSSEGKPALLGPSSTPAPQGVAEAPATSVVQCILRGTGLPNDTVPLYLESATFQGTPAYLAAVQAEGASKSHLRIYVVSQRDCTFLFEADQPL
jgi:hypothetical protein